MTLEFSATDNVHTTAAALSAACRTNRCRSVRKAISQMAADNAKQCWKISRQESPAATTENSSRSHCLQSSVILCTTMLHKDDDKILVANSKQDGCMVPYNKCDTQVLHLLMRDHTVLPATHKFIHESNKPSWLYSSSWRASSHFG